MQTFISFMDSLVKIHGPGVLKKEMSLFVNRRHLSSVEFTTAHQQLKDEGVLVRRTRKHGVQQRNCEQ
jgi:hypothetical protein